MDIKFLIKNTNYTFLIFALSISCFSSYGMNEDIVSVLQRSGINYIRTLLQQGALNVHQQDVQGNTPLHIAAERGDVLIVQLLVENGADINSRDRLMKTPLCNASAKGHYEVVQFLIKHGAIVAEEDQVPFHPLQEAVRGGHLKIVELLADYETDINRSVNDYNSDTETFLHIASWNGSTDIVNFLIKRGAIVDKEASYKITPLANATRRGHKAIVRILIEHGADVNHQDNRGYTPLHYAAQNNYHSIMEFLIAHGAEINKQNNIGEMPLHESCKNRDCMGAQILIAHGAIFNRSGALTNLPDEVCKTKKCHSVATDSFLALMDLLRQQTAQAETRKQAHVIANTIAMATHERLGNDSPLALLPQFLLQYISQITEQAELIDSRQLREGIDSKKSSWCLQPPARGTITIFSPARGGSVKRLLALIHKGASVHEQMPDGSTPLHHAASNGREEIAEALIQHGAVADARNNNMITPLHFAALAGHDLVARVLMKHGANVNAQDLLLQYTPLHVAAHNGRDNVVIALLENGADVNKRDRAGSNPLHLAAESKLGVHKSDSSLNIARILIAHGTDIEAKNFAGHTPYDFAVQRKRPLMMQLIRGSRICIHAAEKRIQQGTVAHTLAMATHQRLGSNSPMRILPEYLLHHISRMTGQLELIEARQSVLVSQPQIEFLTNTDEQMQQVDQKKRMREDTEQDDEQNNGSATKKLRRNGLH